MAANSPAAVATSASEMPGATIASVACCTFPKEENALMMPQTVPKSPTYGLVEPTVASVARLCSSRSISLSCATRMARREPSRSISAATPPCARRRANSRKPNSKMLSMPEVLPRDSTVRYSELRSPPDQKLFSKRSASRRARFTTMRLRKMMAHEPTEAASRIPRTICTTRLACTIRRTTDNSPPINYSLEQRQHWRRAWISNLELTDYDCRQALGFQALRVETSHAHGCAQQQLTLDAVAPDALLEGEAGAPVLGRLTADREHIIEAGRSPVLRLERHHREYDPRIQGERALRHTARAQPFTARALEES